MKIPFSGSDLINSNCPVNRAEMDAYDNDEETIKLDDRQIQEEWPKILKQTAEIDRKMDKMKNDLIEVAGMQQTLSLNLHRMFSLIKNQHIVQSKKSSLPNIDHRKIRNVPKQGTSDLKKEDKTRIRNRIERLAVRDINRLPPSMIDQMIDFLAEEAFVSSETSLDGWIDLIVEKYVSIEDLEKLELDDVQNDLEQSESESQAIDRPSSAPSQSSSPNEQDDQSAGISLTSINSETPKQLDDDDEDSIDIFTEAITDDYDIPSQQYPNNVIDHQNTDQDIVLTNGNSEEKFSKPKIDVGRDQNDNKVYQFINEDPAGQSIHEIVILKKIPTKQQSDSVLGSKHPASDEDDSDYVGDLEPRSRSPSVCADPEDRGTSYWQSMRNMWERRSLGPHRSPKKRKKIKPPH